MSGLSRRAFLTKGSLVVAAGTVVSTMPGLGSALQSAETDATDASGAASEAEVVAASTGGPLVAHVTNLQTGEISLYQGEEEFTLNDPAIAAKLFRAAH